MTRSVIVTIHAMTEPWSVLHQIVCRAAICVSVMSITLAVTVNSPSIKRARHRGGDLLSVDLATVQRIEDLIQVVTSRQESAVAGYVQYSFVQLFT